MLEFISEFKMIDILKAIVYGIVQGITEWLPISSTGHLILLENILPMNVSPEFWNMFLVVIQFGSILAVVLLYWNKLWPFSGEKTPREKRNTFQLWGKIIIGVIPAVIIALPFDDIITEYLYNFVTVAVMLIIYGILFIIVENLNYVKHPRIKSINQINYKIAFLIGCFQALAVIPGTSRSGATIIGALLIGCSRSVSAEFSFFLAIPTMFGASFLKILKFILSGIGITGFEIAILIVGMVVAFVVSVYAIKYLMRYIRRHNFKVFGYYRIVLGIILMIYYFIILRNL